MTKKIIENRFLPHTQLQAFIDTLHHAGFRCIGPQVRDGAIVYDDLEFAHQLPWGIREHQTPGEYRLETIAEHKAFAFANGPQAIKPFLFKSQETVWRVQRSVEGKLNFEPHLSEEQPIAMIGARACDLAAMLIQDKVFIQGQHVDDRYQQRRNDMLVIAVNCTYASNNCFCVSMDTGPRAREGFDILLTEIEAGFVVEVGSVRGESIIQSLRLQLVTQIQWDESIQQVDKAAAMQTRRMPLDNKQALRDLLFSRLNHPRWDEVADRCLSCGNCTSVCPTCFCHSEVEVPSLDGRHSEHQRVWDSCFTAGHSVMNGKVIRDDTKKRYRQWVTHKLGSWFDQFGSSGCVGCGRCMTWCPVGIDLTEEVAQITGIPNVRLSDEG